MAYQPALLVENQVVALLRPIKAKVYTLTSDNSEEFAGYQFIAKALNSN